MTGIVRGYEIGKNRDSSQNVLLLQVEITENNIQAVEYMNAPGDNSIPPVDSIVTILSAGSAWKIAIACNDGKDFDTSIKEGEKYLYSNGENSFIKLLKNGTIELNGNSRDAARKDDSTELVLSQADVVALAGILLATGAFTPTGSPPAPAGTITFTGGKITQGNDKVKMS